jgi:hypothetical protein
LAAEVAVRQFSRPPRTACDAVAPGVQARAFPGDFFIRLPTAASDGPIPAAAFDQALKEIFVNDQNFNSVEVYSTVDGHHVGEISIPGPAGLGFSRDFSKFYVGTITPNVFAVDPASENVLGAFFSRDGKYLYLATQLSHVIVVDTQTGTLAGYVGFATGSLAFYPTLFDVDETYHLIGSGAGGVFILDASKPQTTAPAAMAIFIGPSTAATPNVGPLALCSSRAG